MPESLEDEAATAFQFSPVAHVVLSQRRILEVNAMLSNLFGFTRSELVGHSVRMLYPTKADFERIGTLCETYLRQGKTAYYEDERFMQPKDGEVFWTRARGYTLTPEDPFQHMVWTFEPIADKPSKSSNLTQREREVANHIVNGRTSREIAKKIGISHRTVEVHRANLMKKLGVKNLAALVSEIVLKV